MNLFVLGGTGRTGQHVVGQALARGHAVTVLTRRPRRLGGDGRLRTVVGNPLCVEELEPVLADHDVVISCLGQRSSRDTDLLYRSAITTLRAMSRTGVRRYLVISQGLLFPSWNPFVALARFILARHVADSRAMEQVIRASDVVWTIVRPPRLTDRGTRRDYRVEVGARPRGGWAMRRIDLATFLLDEAERATYENAVVGITSASGGARARTQRVSSLKACVH